MSNLSIFILLTIVGVQIAAGAKYLGCYLDDDADRDFSIAANLGSDITVQGCINHCTSTAYKYAGLQGSICHCGDNYGKYSKVDDSKCNLACGGQSLQKCGSSNKNSVYSTNYLGCWRDSQIRDIPSLYQMSDSDAKIETCINICKSHGYRFAGAQYFTQCFCGNSFGLYAELPKSSCNAECRGNATQNCGGSHANSVYVADDNCGCQ